jgi:hypothetical protein
MKQYTLLFTLTLLFLSVHLLAQKPPTDTKEEPPQPTEGVCFAKSVTPDKFKIVEEQVLVAPAQTKEEFVPALYDTIKQEILVRQSYDKIVTHDAVFDTTYIMVNTKDKSKVIREEYKTIFEVEQKPMPEGEAKGGKWVKTKIPNCNSPNEKDCETMRWVETRAEFDITQKEVFVKAEWADTMEEGATQRVRQIKEIKPAYIEKVFVPAEYEYVDKIVLKRHARKVLTEVPAKYKTVKTKKLVETGGKTVWVEVLCPESLNEIVISQVQLALKGRKMYDGQISGKLDSLTQEALEKFQKEVSLPVGKLDRQTIEALGFNYVIFSKPLDNKSSEDENNW